MALGAELGKSLKPGSVICFEGELGAGKTTFVKGLVQGMSGVAAEKVVSPTFVYLNSYGDVHHFDLYRLSGVDEFFSLGFEEFLRGEGMCCIEWSERIASIIPPEAIKVSLAHKTEGSREISISEYEVCHNVG